MTSPSMPPNMAPFTRRLNEVLANPKLVLSPRRTLADTVVDVLGVLGLKASAATYMKVDDFGVEEQFAAVVSTLDGDTVGRTTIRPVEEHRWTMTTKPADRIGAVRDCVQRAVLDTVSTRTVLTTQPNRPSDRAVQHLTVLAWWQARLNEGHTTTTARLMLSLTVPPDLLRTITFTTDDSPMFDTITLGSRTPSV